MPDGLSRFLSSLVALDLIVEHEGVVFQRSSAARCLTPGNSAYLGDFLLYRRYLSSHWQRLGPRIRGGVRANERSVDESSQQYSERTLAYVRALDIQAQLKCAESLEYLKAMFGQAPRQLLDVGGWAGAWCRVLRRQWPDLRTVLFELPDTIWAAREPGPGPQSMGRDSKRLPELFWRHVSGENTSM